MLSLLLHLLRADFSSIKLKYYSNTFIFAWGVFLSRFVNVFVAKSTRLRRVFLLMPATYLLKASALGSLCGFYWLATLVLGVC